MSIGLPSPTGLSSWLVGGAIKTMLSAISAAVDGAAADALRLTGGPTTDFSDHIRAEVAQQGERDFIHSPIDGVGMQVAAEAHNVYLQSLASGGLILFTGYVIFVVCAALTARRAMRYSELGGPLLAATVSVALLSMVENSLTDRLVYVPAGLVAALYSSVPQLRREPADESDAFDFASP